ncbi:acyl-CoA thioesterase [uncultured Enterovirga sp.]|uniref:acyl-CoA thioesterase n=1 Tax=uncultured Enterovirga sp. TaxID=2026352 RepID=UPI0035C9914A
MSGRPGPETRAAFPLFRSITTRWADNDVFGHVNNVVYYSYFDTVVNQHLIEAGCLDPLRSPIVGLVAETQCRYFSSVAFPDRVAAGLRVARLGTTSVRYEIGLFRNDDDTASAQGHFVHVYVDRATNRPVRLPEALKAALLPLVVGPPPG